MSRFLAFALAFLLALPFAARAQEDGYAAEMRADILALREELTASVAIGTARARLSRAFIETDIVFSRRYLDTWSTLLHDRWNQHLSFFDTQLTALGNWDQALAAGLVSAEEAEAALTPALERIEVMAETMPLWQEDDTLRLAERAFWTDLAQEIGCCEPLYYHALTEAEEVWSGALSPDPAAIAALELVPMVPLDGMVAVDPADRAYAWLASRAEALAGEEDPDPGARRALLTEARLLESLFGLPGGVALERSLSTMAAREGYASRPVAPLVRLAAITEEPYLRAALLERAAERLRDRATHLGLAPVGLPQEEAALRSMAGESDDPAPASEAPAAEPAPSVASEAGPVPAAPAAPALVPPAPEPPAVAPMAVPAPSPVQRPEHVGLMAAAREADAEAAEAVAAALAALTGDALDIDALARIAALSEDADDLLDSADALDILQRLDDDPVTNVTR